MGVVQLPAVWPPLTYITCRQACQASCCTDWPTTLLEWSLASQMPTVADGLWGGLCLSPGRSLRLIRSPGLHQPWPGHLATHRRRNQEASGLGSHHWLCPRHWGPLTALNPRAAFQFPIQGTMQRLLHRLALPLGSHMAHFHLLRVDGQMLPFQQLLSWPWPPLTITMPYAKWERPDTKAHILWFRVYETSCTGKSIETEHTLVAARGWEEGEMGVTL